MGTYQMKLVVDWLIFGIAEPANKYWSTGLFVFERSFVNLSGYVSGFQFNAKVYTVQNFMNAGFNEIHTKEPRHTNFTRFFKVETKLLL